MARSEPKQTRINMNDNANKELINTQNSRLRLQVHKLKWRGVSQKENQLFLSSFPVPFAHLDCAFIWS